MKRNKSIYKFAWIRINEEPMQWGIFVFCLYIVVAYYCDSVKIPSCLSQDTVNKINIIALNLSYSYVAGMIFYVLTVFIPQTKKARILLFNFVEELRLINDSFRELSGLLCGDNWLAVSNAEESVFRDILKFNNLIDLEKGKPIKIPKGLVVILKDFVVKVDIFMNSKVLYETYLSNEESQILTEVHSSQSLSHIRHHFDIMGTYYSEEGFKRLIRGMIQVHKKIDFLYKKMSAKIC